MAGFRYRGWALAATLIAVAPLGLMARSGAGRDTGGDLAKCRPLLERALLRGHGPLVSDYWEATICRETAYRGPGTTLYTNRPYHTEQPVEALVGLSFCRAPRHGTRSWTLAISKATELLTLGSGDLGLEERGWRKLDAEVRVEAAGVSFDALYAKSFAAGRYRIRQDFSRSALPVFWNGQHARLVP